MDKNNIIRAGVSTASLYPDLLEDAFRFLAESGVSVTEIFVNTDSELSGNVHREMLAIKQQNKLTVSAVHPFTCGIETIMLYSEYSRRIPDFLDYYKRYFEYAQSLEAEFFILHGAKTPMRNSETDNFDRYMMLCEAAKPYGVTVLQENVKRCESRRLKFLTHMKDYLGDNANFVLDTKQAVRSGEDPTEIIKTLGKNVKHIHFSDSGQKGDCLFYKDGEYDNSMLFKALADIEYSGVLMIETYKDLNDPGYARKLIENYYLLKNDLEEFNLN